VTSIPAGQRSVDITYTVAEDNADVPRGEATYVLGTSSAYTLSSMVSVSLEVVDNDATRVSLTAGDDDVVEGDTKGVSIVFGRGLVSGEALVVPLTFGGTATRGTDYTLEGSPARGVSFQNLNSGSASVTVTGPESGASARIAVLLLTAETDDVDEPDGETVEFAPGTLNENSGTGLDGGASSIGEESFSIQDPVPNAVNLSVSDDGDATEGGDALTITATLVRALRSTVTIPIEVNADGTTAQAADYTVASGILISAGARSGTTSFTVTDDEVAESTETVLVELGATLPLDTVSGEANDVGISITDNDTADLVISPTTLGVAEGDDASYTVELATLPTGTVTVAITVPAGTDLTLDTTSLEFTTSTWDTAQTVTVTAGEDDDTTDDTATLTHEASGGGYDNLGRELAVTVTDNDAAGLVISPPALEVDEGDDASYTVRLASAPSSRRPRYASRDPCRSWSNPAKSASSRPRRSSPAATRPHRRSDAPSASWRSTWSASLTTACVPPARIRTDSAPRQSAHSCSSASSSSRSRSLRHAGDGPVRSTVTTHSVSSLPGSADRASSQASTTRSTSASSVRAFSRPARASLSHRTGVNSRNSTTGCAAS